MGISIDQFFTTYNGKGVDFDGSYGNQCVDLAQFYNRDVVGAPVLVGSSALDIWNKYPSNSAFYDKILNSPSNYPSKGDLVFWNLGQFGHVAIAETADVNKFTSFDQNYPSQGYLDDKGNFIGTGVCHMQLHDYQGVVGWLRPKPQQSTQNIPVGKLLITIPGGVHVRPAPSINNTPVTTLESNSIVSFIAIVVGDLYMGNNVWYKLDNGSYIWSGAAKVTQAIPQSLPPLPGETNTAYDEKAAITVLGNFTAKYGGNLEGAARALWGFWLNGHQTTTTGGVIVSN